MTSSWLCQHTHGHHLLLISVCVVLCCVGASSPGGGCWDPALSSCTECLRRGPQCAWCFQEGFLEGAEGGRRCDLPVNLRRRGCSPLFMEHPQVQVEVNATLGGTQVLPSDISITLRPGSEASFIVAVQQLQVYPVDLYYLVDVSASMQDNLDKLRTVGVALSHRMAEFSSDLRLGFGSFVDKPVSPYINVHPSKISNPCSDYEIRCRPAHGYHHVLSLTDNVTEFTRVVKRQRISGNMDTPEGGLDAMLQAAVCQSAVGWRAEAKRLLLLMTDQPSHLALDSRLAGIVTPHDGLCHLENNVYAESTTMDHPSMGQLADKLLENHIHSVFAVENQQYQWYEGLVDFLPGSYLGKLGFFQTPSLIELVVDAYKRLLSEVQVSVSIEDRQVSRYWLSVSPICPPGASVSSTHGCTGVQPNQTVYFNITVGLRSCPDGPDDEAVLVRVRPVGYNESTVVTLRSHCRCRCQATGGRCGDGDEPAAPCRGSSSNDDEDTGDLEDVMRNDPHRDTLDSGREEELEEELEEGAESCRAEGAELQCSGRGACTCGRCVCERSRLGTVYGKYCERDDFSCPYHRGELCAGRGECVSGQCVCDAGWTGESCSCPVSTESCGPAAGGEGPLCSGRGRCVCGRCVCDDPRFSGAFCQSCPLCHSTCQSYWKCVECHLSHGLTQVEGGHCNHTCVPLVGYVDDMSGVRGELWAQCVYTSHSDGCRYRFHTSLVSARTQLHITTHPECASRGGVLGTFLCVCALTLLCGLVVVAVTRLLLQRRGRPLEGATGTDVGGGGGYLNTGKDLAYIPTTTEKTVTYRRDRPPDRVEMHIQVPKMPLGASWQC